MKNTRKCKECKEQFTPYNSLQKYCFKPECTKVFVEIEKAKQWRKTKAVKKEELMTIMDWMKVAQSHFNHYIRLRDKGLPCISCGKEIKQNEIVHASHFKPAGTCYATRFHEDNCFVSCVKCNNFLSGNLTEYRKRLIDKIGIQRVESVESLSVTTKKFTVDEIKEIISTYKQKIKELQSK